MSSLAGKFRFEILSLPVQESLDFSCVWLFWALFILSINFHGYIVLDLTLALAVAEKKLFALTITTIPAMYIHTYVLCSTHDTRNTRKLLPLYCLSRCHFFFRSYLWCNTLYYTTTGLVFDVSIDSKLLSSELAVLPLPLASPLASSSFSSGWRLAKDQKFKPDSNYGNQVASHQSYKNTCNDGNESFAACQVL